MLSKSQLSIFMTAMGFASMPSSFSFASNSATTALPFSTFLTVITHWAPLEARAFVA